MKFDKKHVILAVWTGLLCGLWAGFTGTVSLVV